MTDPVLDIHLRWRLYYVECSACFPLVLLVMCKDTSWRYITSAKLHVGTQRKRREGGEGQLWWRVMSDLVSGIEAIFFFTMNELAEIAPRKSFHPDVHIRYIWRNRRLLSRSHFIKHYLLHPPESTKMLTSNAKYLSINFCRFYMHLRLCSFVTTNRRRVDYTVWLMVRCLVIIHPSEDGKWWFLERNVTSIHE